MEGRGAIDEAQVRTHVAKIAAIAGLGGLLFGYDTGIIAGALLYIDPDFGLSSFESGLVVAAVPLGAVAGAALAGRFSTFWGRRSVVLASALVFAIGAIGSAAAPEVVTLTIARIFLGVAIGLASATVPVYISEVAPPQVRGRLVTFFQLAVTVGIVVAYLVSLAFDPVEGWRWMLGLGAIPALALGIGMLTVPPSPRWLVMEGRRDDAREVLLEIRTGGDQVVEDEITEIEDGLRSEGHGKWRDLLDPTVRAALVVGVGLAILQQVSGINTVIYYAPTIIKFTGIESSAASIVASIGVGIVNVALTVVAIRLLDRAGRKPLLLWGSALMAIALASLAIVFATHSNSGAGSAIAILGLMLYVGAFAVSLGPIFWLMNGEIYPLAVRSQAAAVGTMANWLFNFIVSLTFLLLVDAIGRDGAFFFYAGICVVTFFFCRLMVPETKGKTLEQIQDIFRKRAGVATAPQT
jgi:SP family galactose:H+ symporter-like MFS transporter